MPVPEPPVLPPSRRAAKAMSDAEIERAPEPEAPLTRRALRQAREAAAPPAIFRAPPPPLVYADHRVAPLVPSRYRRRTPVGHARASKLARWGLAAAIAAAGSLVLGSTSAVTVAMAPEPTLLVAELPQAQPVFDVSINAPATLTGEYPGPVASIPPTSGPAVQEVNDPCADPVVTSALAVGDEMTAITAMGGAAAFRATVATGLAPCVLLGDPARTWVVVDKLRPYAPIDYAPPTLAQPAGMPNLGGETLRQDAADALSALAAAGRAAGVGELGLGSGYRSYETQVATYSGHVSRKGADQADLVSARPGHSEHQSGLAADVVPCADVCGTIDDLAATPQGAWVAAHAWEYGWIVRYEEGGTGVTGFLPEPWHLRYIGPDLSRAYHEGGWRSLEEFFGLPAAPHYDH